ncbi:phosphoribosylformylglycinamidine cyclo-ligase [Nesterenkonia alkaliphila]|uniref:Phosphoribosylformylglycinamidine cyclo-ligase n=1 Tax=Nesterenkonia alkaliphila TaxID=1463631 RepID=A0A7K1UI41_9MICC|nr:phosphoribosylformylglycinamidine cyclo-ligase [Nesterenkonia alkaliphila]MVT26052.1 phosphoribosylformylglycinamidine cyclo-ligase [Nesterenkonia alkaliphila]GFZ86381.1 phosphoribosylformylglycinamidine cyclo-ligase [Nesterenkonia alkaliphila]
MSGSSPITYASAGVDVEAGDRAVELMKAHIEATHTPQVVGGFGGFAGLYDASELKRLPRPLLATSTDGVGTKVAIAQAMDIHDTIGYDLVGMVVDDIVVAGAKPLFMTDYIACGKVEPTRIAAIVSGIAKATAEAGTALVGGETAEHPGLLGEHEYDVAGAATGVVDASAVLGPERVRSGDVVIGMASSGIHSNGYSLVRRIVREAGWAFSREVPEFGRTLGEELLEPTKLYTAPCLDLVTHFNGDPAVTEVSPDAPIRGFSHVTGGGMAANLARVLPSGLLATVDRSTWAWPEVFTVMADLGRVPQADLERTLNLGVGMIAVVAAEAAEGVVERLNTAGQHSWVMGTISEYSPEDVADAGQDFVQGAKGVDGGGVLLTGRYA